jgi:hypothetical protein
MFVRDKSFDLCALERAIRIMTRNLNRIIDI